MTRNQKILYTSHAVLFVLFCAIVFVPEFYFGGKTKDYPRWYRVGTTFLTGENLYDGFYFLYPPFSALLMALPVPLGKIGHYLTVLIVSMASWITVISITGRLLGDQSRLRPWQVLVPIVLVLPFLIENFDLGQPNVLLLMLMLFGLLCLRKEQNFLAGLSFGSAVAIKFFPITVLPYLLWRRYWVASAVLIVTAIALNFLAPAPFRGFDRNALEIVQWYDGMKGGDDGFGQRTNQNWSWKNQSIIAVTHRYVRHLNYNAVDKNMDPAYINIIDVEYETANIITLAVASLIGLGFILIIPRFHNRTKQTDTIEFAVLFCLMTIASPLARNYYFVWLYMPIATLIYFSSIETFYELKSSIFKVLVAATAVGLLALSIFPRIFQAAGNYLIMTGILIFGLTMLMRLAKRDSHISS